MDEAQQLRELFNKFDVDGNGSITPGEVQEILQEVGIAATPADAALMVSQVDRNHDGKIELNEFMGMKGSMLSKVVGKNRDAILTVQHGAANSQHSYSSEETAAFTEVVNSRLAGDVMLPGLPLTDPSGLFQACADGILLCRLIGLVDADAVDERAINTTKLSKFKIIENVNLAINAAKDIGCRITNIGAHDVMEARPHLILGVLWQIIRLLLTAKISLTEVPEMVRLLEGDETLQMLLALPPERVLVRWINYHLAAANSDRRIHALGKELSDSVVYSTLMTQLYGIGPIDTSAPLEKRAAAVLRNAESVGVKPFIKAGDVVSGNAKLNLSFVAQLFNDRHGLAPLDEEEQKGLAELDIDDAGDTREARTFKLWLNSLNLVDNDSGELVQVNDLFRELCNGLPILSVMDHIESGSVPWKKVVKNPKNKHHLVENGNHVVETGRKMDLVLVNIGGPDIAAGSKKLILAVMWQLMRRSTVDLLSSLKGDGSKVEEKEIIAWANSKVASCSKPNGRPSSPIRNLGDKSLKNSHFLIDLCASISPDTVNWELVTPGISDEDATLNARYALSIARKMGCGVFCTPEDIVEVKPKMILFFIAAVWQCDMQRGKPRPVRASSPPPAPVQRRAVPPVPPARPAVVPPPPSPDAPPVRSAPEAPPTRAAPPPPPPPPSSASVAQPPPSRAPPPPPPPSAAPVVAAPAPPPVTAAPRAPPPAVPSRAPARAPPPLPPVKKDNRKPLPPGAPKNYAVAPPPPKSRPATTTGFEDEAHVVQLKQPEKQVYSFKSVNGTGETEAAESNDVEEDEWD